METKFTKGKWEIFHQEEDIFIESDISTIAIAEMVGGTGSAEAEANAKLIAAAPDLLISIMAMKELSEREKEPSEEEFKEVDAMIDAAILKATQ